MLFKFSPGWIILISLIISACGQRTTTKLNKAPRSSNQAGLIASCTDEDEAEILAKKFNFQYRVINSKRGLIEYVGISKKKLKEILPKSRLFKNKIYKNSLVQSLETQSIEGLNDPYYGAHDPRYRSFNNEQHKQTFNHLTQIDGFEVGENNRGKGITIAIIDTGVFYNHPHLSPNIKINNGEIDGDGIDNDRNGHVDDNVGWDFFNNDRYPIDDEGHGTHVAGIAAGTLGGIAQEAKILPIKVLNHLGQGDLGTIAQGILYAVDQGADIINLSLGGSADTSLSSDIQALFSSVEIAQNQDVLVVAAAGNGGYDQIGDCNDAEPMYPANIDSTSVISVSSVDDENQLTDYSNYGPLTVHTSAPGGFAVGFSLFGIYSAALYDCSGPCESERTEYVQNLGTSMATPVVAGLAAIIKSVKPNLNHKQIKEIILQSGQYSENLQGKTLSAKVVNIKNAIDMALSY